jgi:hypothetical protein
METRLRIARIFETFHVCNEVFDATKLQQSNTQHHEDDDTATLVYFLFEVRCCTLQLTSQDSNMISIKNLLSLLFLLVSVATTAFARRKDDEEAAQQALRDLQIGMNGLKEAGSNPAMLAQMMRDLQVGDAS